MKRLLVFCLVIASGAACAAEIDPIVGKYVYVAYEVTLPNGKTIGFPDMGVESATLEIRPSMSVRLVMHMKNGRAEAEEAKISEVKIDGASGYFTAQWPDMTYPVEERFTLIRGGMKYQIHFNDASDRVRFASRERATLRRVGVRQPKR